jgi:hypothetical protein
MNIKKMVVERIICLDLLMHRVVRGQEIILNMSDCGKTLLGVKETLKLEV